MSVCVYVCVCMHRGQVVEFFAPFNSKQEEQEKSAPNLERLSIHFYASPK